VTPQNGQDTILNNPFNLEDYKKLISGLVEHAFYDEGKNISFSSDVIESATNIGEFQENRFHNLLVIKHSSTIFSRIKLATETFKLMAANNIDTALIAYYSEKDKLWRVSLVTLKFEEGQSGKITKVFSNPRRYSYVLGPTARTVTPYKFLISKGEATSYEDLESRFSVEVVNNEFYKEIAKLYDELIGTDSKNAVMKYPDSGDASQQFAVRLIGRIVFCWFLREKHSNAGMPLIDKNILSRESANQKDYYNTTLAPLFFEVLNKPLPIRPQIYQNDEFGKVPYLNGGLFAPQPDDHYKVDKVTGLPLHSEIDIPDTWIRKLLDLLELYHFTVDENTSVDIDLSIDPEMLGRIFENLLARINPETGETVRRTTGSFYTPREIVEYMVDESLLQYLINKTKIPEDSLRALISYDLSDDKKYPINDTEKNLVVKSISDLKVLDPACGSGAFPIGMLQKIVFILQQIDPEAHLWFENQIINTSPEVRRLIEREFQHKNFDYIRKLGIIRESIFGVDIQPIATEIARLRCFLTLIVDERVDDDEANRGIYPLPNLDFKFVTANTLIPLPDQSLFSTEIQQDIFDSKQLDKIERLRSLRNDYFNAHNTERSEIKSEFRLTQNELWMAMHSSSSYGKQSLALSGWDPFSYKATDWFDVEWMFGLGDGFDIVIANPPYVRIHKQDADKKELMKKIYNSAVGDYDIYILFFEQGLNLLAKNGVLIYITPDKYLVRDYGKVLRQIILNKKIVRLIDISRADDAFQAATYPLITIIVNDIPAEQISVNTVNSIKNINDSSRETFISHADAKKNNMIEIIDPTDLKIINKIYSNSSPLSEVISKNQLFCGTPRAKDYKAWGTKVITDTVLSDNTLPLYVCASMSPYRINTSKTVRALGNRVISPYFDNNEGSITDQRWEDFKHKPKILIRGNDTRITAVLDTTGSVFVGVYAIKIMENIEDNYMSILGQLNSKLLNWVFKVQNPSVRIGGGYFSINSPQLMKLPLIPTSSDINSKLSNISENIINLPTDDESSFINLSNQIDEHMYTYYGLSNDEINVIENLV